MKSIEVGFILQLQSPILFTKISALLCISCCLSSTSLVLTRS